MTDYPIGIGDVALDLAQGRPVHVVATHDETADEWSESNNYELADNYANARFGTTGVDRVFDCVYCSSAKSEPTKTYAFPESRLLRIETEAADDGRPVYQRAVRDTLESLFGEFLGTDEESTVTTAATEQFGVEIVDEAKELADVDRRIGGEAE